MNDAMVFGVEDVIELIVLSAFVLIPEKRLETVVSLFVFPLAKGNSGLYRCFEWFWSNAINTSFIRLLCLLLLSLKCLRLGYLVYYYKFLIK